MFSAGLHQWSKYDSADGRRERYRESRSQTEQQQQQLVAVVARACAARLSRTPVGSTVTAPPAATLLYHLYLPTYCTSDTTISPSTNCKHRPVKLT